MSNVMIGPTYHIDRNAIERSLRANGMQWIPDFQYDKICAPKTSEAPKTLMYTEQDRIFATTWDAKSCPMPLKTPVTRYLCLQQYSHDEPQWIRCPTYLARAVFESRDINGSNWFGMPLEEESLTQYWRIALAPDTLFDTNEALLHYQEHIFTPRLFALAGVCNTIIMDDKTQQYWLSLDWLRSLMLDTDTATATTQHRPGFEYGLSLDVVDDWCLHPLSPNDMTDILFGIEQRCPQALVHRNVRLDKTPWTETRIEHEFWHQFLQTSYGAGNAQHLKSALYVVAETWAQELEITERLRRD